jgi:hypothetical protein
MAVGDAARLHVVYEQHVVQLQYAPSDAREVETYERRHVPLSSSALFIRHPFELLTHLDGVAPLLYSKKASLEQIIDDRRALHSLVRLRLPTAFKPGTQHTCSVMRCGPLFFARGACGASSPLFFDLGQGEVGWRHRRGKYSVHWQRWPCAGVEAACAGVEDPPRGGRLPRKLSV